MRCGAKLYSSESVQRMSTPSLYDVVVCGGGVVGAAAMASLQQLRARLLSENTLTPHAAERQALAGRLSRLLLADPMARPQYNAESKMHNLRTVSLTPVSSRLLDNLGCWKQLQTRHAYYRIALRHEHTNSPEIQRPQDGTKTFMSSLMGGGCSTAEPLLEFMNINSPLGFISYNAEINTRLLDAIEERKVQDAALTRDNGETGEVCDRVEFGSALDSYVLPPESTIDGPPGTAVMRGPSGEEALEFSLLLGCDGRGSQLRNQVGTYSVSHDYRQTVYVCTVQLEPVVDGNVCCFQNFFSNGDIVAMLPTSPDTANIVFSTTAAHARKLAASTQVELVKELNNRLHAFAARDIPQIISVPEEDVCGQVVRAQGMFPSRLQVVVNNSVPRCLLMGDAAHSIHPFAGQGMNLGLYDVCTMIKVLEKAIRNGQDIGSFLGVGRPFLSEVAVHSGSIIAALEAIYGLVTNAPKLSCFGMSALQNVPLLSSLGKQSIIHVASGGLLERRHKECFLLQ
uniref:Putative Monooxygenase n=1 Tax=Trypanosoma vivax (strain Y486) TaxID=1055687 RepID=G0TZ71_TRYVY|nr:putative Monooxygenase [Trypanosoma vivax Y486]